MGAVYLGRGADNRFVAVKVIRPELAADRTFRARFQDEVTNAQRVASFCTAQVLDHGEQGGSPYLVTEYVDGKPLDEYIANQGALPPGTLHGVAVGVAAALTAIHSVELVHRDLKPSNVMLSVSGPRVIDFGIARATDAAAQHTQTGFVVGSPGWMAPEQVMRGETTTAVDIFAWGTLVAFAATGRHPYGTGTLVTMAARAQANKPDLDGLSEELVGVVRSALDPEPERRPTAQQLLLSLVGGAEEVATGQDAQAVADQELNRTWVAEALPPDLIPPPWVPPSPPRGVRMQMPPPRHYTPPPAPLPPPQRAPVPPPVMQPPYAARRRSHRRWPIGCLVVLVILMGLVIIAVATLRNQRPTEGTLGQESVDGQFSFVVRNPVTCGKNAAIRGVTATRGRLCQVRVTVENTGTKQRTLSPGNQKLIENSGSEVEAVKLMRVGANKRLTEAPDTPLAPQEKFTGVLVFDVSTTSEPESVELHDAQLSRGVSVPLS
ncbi:protein kinase [Actinomadura alba]|uniref:Protein kinase n=2 Tax=Actinomadura alba TaxID=406431 RepID=A0ABR7LQU2_9ACTN|nr:protein kinase [Actinomadura alba]